VPQKTRPRAKDAKRKKGQMDHRHVTISFDLSDWVEANSGAGQRFSSFSHAVQVALQQLRERSR
jgi:hypothetical protein